MALPSKDLKDFYIFIVLDLISFYCINILVLAGYIDKYLPKKCLDLPVFKDYSNCRENKFLRK